MSTAPAEAPPGPRATVRSFELPASVVIAVVGAILTTVGSFNHGGPGIAPGATLLLIGGAWLGNVLARKDVPLLPIARSHASTAADDERRN